MVSQIPILSKHVETLSFHGLHLTSMTSMGRRFEQEDVHVMIPNIYDCPESKYFKKKSVRPVLLAAVFDGHGGKDCANYMAKHLPKKLSNLTFHNLKNKESTQPIFTEIDQEFQKENHKDSGTTVIMILIELHLTPFKPTRYSPTDSLECVVIRLGDPIICSYKYNKSDLNPFQFQSEFETILTPSSPGEQKRIEDAGSIVRMDRVNGRIAVSRALGDYSYKNKKKPWLEQPVCCEIEHKVIKIVCNNNESEKQQILIGCDGLTEGKRELNSFQSVIEACRKDEGNNEFVSFHTESMMNEKSLVWMFDDVMTGFSTNDVHWKSQDNISVILIDYISTREDQVSKKRFYPGVYCNKEKSPFCWDGYPDRYLTDAKSAGFDTEEEIIEITKPLEKFTDTLNKAAEHCFSYDSVFNSYHSSVSYYVDLKQDKEPEIKERQNRKRKVLT